MKQTTWMLAGLLSVSCAALAEEEFFDLGDSPTLAVDNVNGDIQISGWDRSQIRVNYRIDGDTSQRDRVRVDMRTNGDRLVIDVEHEKNGMFGWFGDAPEVDFEIQVPFNADLKSADSVNGDIDIDDVAGAVSAESVNGDIRIRGARGSVSADTVNGDVDLLMLRVDRGQNISMESVNGDIEITMPEDAGVRVDIETLNGDVDSEFELDYEHGRFVGLEVRGVLGDGGAQLGIETVNGDITLEARSN